MAENWMRHHVRDDNWHVKNAKPGEDVTLKNGGDTLTILTWGEAIQPFADYWAEKTGKKVTNQHIADTGLNFSEEISKYLAGGEDADLIQLESQHLPVSQENLAPLSALGIDLADCSALYPYTLQTGTGEDGVLRALPVNACPGGYLYRSDLAKEYLGVTSPEEMQKKVCNWETFAETARTVSDKTNGKTALAATIGGLLQAFSNRIPWTDPSATSTLSTFASYLSGMQDNGFVTRQTQWTGEWYTIGTDASTMGYFTSNWTPDVFSGRDMGEHPWSICAGPKPFCWGGTWLGVSKQTDNADECKAFLTDTILNAEIAAEIVGITKELSSNADANEIAVAAGCQSNR